MFARATGCKKCITPRYIASRRRGWRLSYEDVRGLIRGLAGHLSRELHRPLELSYFCIMESSAKRACRARAHVHVWVYAHAWKHVGRQLDLSRVAENNATCRKTRLRPRRDFVRKIIRRANFPRGFGSGKKVTTVYRARRAYIPGTGLRPSCTGEINRGRDKNWRAGKLLSIGNTYWRSYI